MQWMTLSTIKIMKIEKTYRLINMIMKKNAELLQVVKQTLHENCTKG